MYKEELAETRSRDKTSRQSNRWPAKIQEIRGGEEFYLQQ